MIKEILDNLHPQERRRLMYAFEHDMGQFVEYKEGKFVGVNVTHIRHLTIEESAGVWAAGNIGKPVPE